MINIKKINFYYFLLKDILKEALFIYQISFLLKTRIFIIKLIKSNSQIFSFFNSLENKVNDKLQYILEVITDSKYYMKIYYKYKENSQQHWKKKNKFINEEAENYSKSKSTTSYSISINNIDSSILNSDIPNNISPKDYASFNSHSSLYSKEKLVERDENKIKEKDYFVLIFNKILPDNNKKIIKEYTSDFVTQIDKYILTVNSNGKIIIYNDSYNIIFELILESTINNLFLVNQENKDSKNDLFIAISTKTKIYLYNFNELQLNKEPKQLMVMNYKSLFLIEANNKEKRCFGCYEDKVESINNLFSKILNSENYSIFQNILLMKSAIKINKVAHNGKDKLIFYNYDIDKEIINESIKNIEKDEFSFIYSTNGMTVFPDEKNFNNGYKFKVILCACKKYIENQKNGILLVNIDDELYKIDYNSSLKINYYFYDTNSFEVYCFCPIFIYEKTRNVLKNPMQSTDYFFVSGFDKEKIKG